MRTAHFRFAGRSDTGRLREANEDSFALLPDRGLFVVSDGMGGHRAGDVASGIVVRVLPEIWAKRWSSIRSRKALTIQTALRDAIVELSRQLHDAAAAQSDLAGAGATVVLAFLHRATAFVAHMGDSRAYMWRRGTLARLTEDHTVASLLARNGEISFAEVATHPAAGALSRYVGMKGVVYPDVRAVGLAPGDRLLLCTDGLTGTVSEKLLGGVLARARGPEAACQRLIYAANAAGGRDNVTAVVVDWSVRGPGGCERVLQRDGGPRPDGMRTPSVAIPQRPPRPSPRRAT